MSTDTIPALVTDVAAIDWNDLSAVAAASDKLLTALDSDRTMLRELAERALDNPELHTRKRMNIAHANSCLRQLTKLHVLA